MTAYTLDGMYVPPLMHLVRPQPSKHTYCGLELAYRIDTADDTIWYFEVAHTFKTIQATDYSPRATCKACLKEMHK